MKAMRAVMAGAVVALGEGLAGRVARSGDAMVLDDYSHWEGRSRVYPGSPFRRVIGVPLKLAPRRNKPLAPAWTALSNLHVIMTSIRLRRSALRRRFK